MELKLNIYKDESLTEVDRVVTADKLKIPYKVSTYIIQSLDDVNLSDNNDLLQFIVKSVDKMDRIIKATFNITDSELELIETTELIDTLKELYRWGIEKINGLKGGEKNV